MHASLNFCPAASLATSNDARKLRMSAALLRQSFSLPYRAFRQKTVDIGRLPAGQDANRTQDFDKECRTRVPSRLLKNIVAHGLTVSRPNRDKLMVRQAHHEVQAAEFARPHPEPVEG
jgi:hypothetical protein